MRKVFHAHLPLSTWTDVSCWNPSPSEAGAPAYLIPTNPFDHSFFSDVIALIVCIVLRRLLVYCLETFSKGIMGPIKICPCWVCVFVLGVSLLYRWLLWRRHTIIILMNTTTLRVRPFLRAGCLQGVVQGGEGGGPKEGIITFVYQWVDEIAGTWPVDTTPTIRLIVLPIVSYLQRRSQKWNNLEFPRIRYGRRSTTNELVAGGNQLLNVY